MVEVAAIEIQISSSVFLHVFLSGLPHGLVDQELRIILFFSPRKETESQGWLT